MGLFCEDVRRELNGQYTIVGTLPDSINVPGVPATIPKLALFIRSNFEPKFDLKTLEFELLKPSGEIFHSNVADKDIILRSFHDANDTGLPIAGLISVSTLSPFLLTEEGTYLLMAKVNKDEPFMCGALKIKIEAPASN